MEQAVKLNPKYVDAYFNLGAGYYYTGKFERSLDNYLKADKLQPGDDKTLYGIASAQFALNRFSESLTNCKKALSINPQNEDAKTLLEMLKERVQN